MLTSNFSSPAYETPPIKKGNSKKLIAVKRLRSPSDEQHERYESSERMKDPTRKLVSVSGSKEVEAKSEVSYKTQCLTDLENEKLRRLTEI